MKLLSDSLKQVDGFLIYLRFDLFSIIKDLIIMVYFIQTNFHIKKWDVSNFSSLV